ncbi:YciI family protein [Sinomonas susongensis]|uniref:YciI family protein n=1 Tax=Sinomonas susongensis TaxID=1324851 RepID=UPI0011091B19|nr:hypothetical protein [Sinomonas susongensis]
MEFVVLYDIPPGADVSRLPEVFPRHKAYYEAFHAAGGGVKALGTFENPMVNGSMGLFTSREDAERFVTSDPFVTEGLASPRILAWDPVRFD